MAVKNTVLKTTAAAVMAGVAFTGVGIAVHAETLKSSGYNQVNQEFAGQLRDGNQKFVALVKAVERTNNNDTVPTAEVKQNANSYAKYVSSEFYNDTLSPAMCSAFNVQLGGTDCVKTSVWYNQLKTFYTNASNATASNNVGNVSPNMLAGGLFLATFAGAGVLFLTVSLSADIKERRKIA